LIVVLTKVRAFVKMQNSWR